jgi:hypothetical protein
MNDKYKVVSKILERIEELDQESALTLWVGITSYLALRWPNYLFHVMRNLILNPFTSPQVSSDFGKIAAAVFFSTQYEIFNNKDYKEYYDKINNGEDN